MARETGVTTLLAGDGGDELFAATNVTRPTNALTLSARSSFLRKGLIEQ